MAYVAPIVARAEAIAAKIEATYCTDPVPTVAANAVRLASRAWSSIVPGYEFPNLRDDVMNNAYVPLVSAFPAGQKARLTIQWELKGLGSAYTGSTFVDADPLIQCCGWAGTFGSASWTYAPIAPSTLRPSCTVYVWAGGNQYKVSGCRGNFEMRILAGQIIRTTFTLEGILQATPLAAAVPAPTFTAVVPPAAVAQAMSIGPWAADYDEIVVRSNNTLAWLYSGNSRYFTTDGGLHSYDIGLMRPEYTITARSVPQGTYDPVVDWSTATTRALAVGWGVTANNKGTITDPAIYVPSDPATEIQKDFTGWRATYRGTAPALLFN